MGSKLLGNYEVDTEENFIRMKIGSSNQYEYMVSPDSPDAHTATRMFERGYERGQSDLRRSLRDLLGAGK